MYHFQVTVTLTLTSDIVFKDSCLEHSFYIILGTKSKFGVCMHLEITKSREDNWVTMTLALTSDLVSRICIGSGAYLLYSVSKEFQI